MKRDKAALFSEIRKLAREARETLPGVLSGEASGELIEKLLDRIESIEQSLAEQPDDHEPSPEFELLSDISLLLSRTMDQREVLRAIIEGLHRAIPYDAAGIFMLDDTGSVISASIVRGYHPDSLDKLSQKLSKGIIGWVISQARPTIVDDVTKDPRYIEALAETRSEVAVPIIGTEGVIGCINLESFRPAAFKPENIRLIEDMASQAAVALERAKIHSQLVAARQIERELQIARRIQVHLLPLVDPDIPGYDIAGMNVPSREIGGDYYDFIRIAPDELGIVVADVAGKGVPAGLVMAGLRAALHTRVETTFSIRHIFEGINRFLLESTGPDAFVTAFYGVLNIPSGQLTYVNAGHNPPMLLHSDGTLVELKAGGPLLGVMPEADFRRAKAELEPGAILCLFTDGITEAGGDTGEEFGEQRVERVLRRFADQPAGAIEREIEREAVEFTKGRGTLDDRTVVVVKRL